MQQKNVSDQPLAAVSDRPKGNGIKKIAAVCWVLAFLCRKLLAALCGGTAAIPLLTHFYAFGYCSLWWYLFSGCIGRYGLNNDKIFQLKDLSADRQKKNRS